MAFGLCSLSHFFVGFGVFCGHKLSRLSASSIVLLYPSVKTTSGIAVMDYYDLPVDQAFLISLKALIRHAGKLLVLQIADTTDQ